MLKLVFLLLAMLCTPLLAQDASQAQLDELRHQLNELREELNRYQGEQENLQRQLQQEELELARLHREISSTERSISTSRNVSVQLESEAEDLRAQIQSQRKRVSQELAAMYRGGPQESLKLLLNQEDPGKFSLMLGYYRRILSVREEKIRRYRETEAALQENMLAQKEEQQRLEQLLASLDDQRDNLSTSLGRRQSTLAALSSEIADTEELIARKEADQRRLESLITSVRRRTEELAAPSSVTPFREIQGKCHWPAEGRLTGRFGQVRTGSMRWNGVFITASDGSEVQTIHHGRVLFADYLRGYGLLVIVDHDEDYLTLYGHNQYLFVEAGEWVQTGQVIARVGDTGGQQDAGLYFEIRRDGKPADPAKWCN